MNARVLALLLLTPVLLAGCTSERDGDGFQPSLEANGWTIRVNHANGTILEYEVTSDPTLADTDGDGLNDFQEFQANADPRNIDTDGDRLLDGPRLCPEPGSELHQRILARDILADPTEEGCYLGESRWELDGIPVRTDPSDADTDTNPTIGDGLLDSEEIIGWEVTVGPRTYHVWSNPSQNSPDSDGDGLHDGLERRFALDPTLADTDGDGFSDQVDAAPLGNLLITVTLESVDLKTDYRLTGGARLEVDVLVAGMEKTIGPINLDAGANRVESTLNFDVPDRASSFTPEGAGAERWSNEVSMHFFHDTGQDREPIRVRGGDNGHSLRMIFDAFQGSWTGHAQGGTSSGPDADVTLSMGHTVVQVAN